MSKVFISYSEKDKSFVDWLVHKLKEENIDVWYDQQEINVGDTIAERIKEGINACSFFIVILSGSSVKSKWVSFELNRALLYKAEKSGVKILPVLIERIEVPPSLSA